MLQWLRRIDKRTVVIILSDGWDTGEPEQLAHALALEDSARPVDLVESAARQRGYEPRNTRDAGGIALHQRLRARTRSREPARARTTPGVVS